MQVGSLYPETVVGCPNGQVCEGIIDNSHVEQQL